MSFFEKLGCKAFFWFLRLSCLFLMYVLVYNCNFRSTAAVAGENFAVIASDTRMSQFEINILTRKAEKISVL